MKIFISTLLFVFSIGAWAGSIHQCEDAQGNMSFSNEPCETAAAAISTLTQGGNNRRLKNTAIKRIIINNQSDFDKFAQNLSFNNMSEVLRGLERNRFHGVKLTYLLAQKDIQHDSRNAPAETLALFADIKPGKYVNKFSVSYSLKLKGQEQHKFFNLSNEKLISRMNSLGFGKPIVAKHLYSWAWRHGSVNCELNYKRSPKDINKFFNYACSEKGY